jgi:prepilin-type N-terminal cleavage/methylation domain-containing protein
MNTIKGYTLIELVIVIIVFSIVASTAGVFLVQSIQSYETAKPILRIAGSVNIAVDNMTRELKSAESVTVASATSITFVNQQGESIAISLSGSNLNRDVNSGGAQRLLGNVTSLSINKFNAALATTATPGDIRFVSINLTASDGDASISIIAATSLRKKL